MLNICCAYSGAWSVCLNSFIQNFGFALSNSRAACLDANDLYIEAKDQYDVFKDILSGSPEGVIELGNLQKSMDSLTVLMKTKACKKGA